MKTEFYIGLLFFACAVSAGFYAGGSSLNGYVWFAEYSIGGNDRNPAAIKREIDFSRLDGAELITATQKRLITAARIELQQEGIGVVLGHFATRGEDGQRRLACDSTFNRLNLRFDADGFAEGGEKPTMTIDAPCRSSLQDVGSIDAVVIPYEKILKEHATNSELTYEEGVNFKFENMGGQWPMHWALTQVRLYNTEGPEHEVKISNRELREIRKGTIMIHWNTTSASVGERDVNRVPAQENSDESEQEIKQEN